MEDQYVPAEMELPEEPNDSSAPSHQDSKEGEQQAKKFTEVVQASRRILFQAKNVFPFDLFTDKLIIDENKIDIVFGTFFYSKEVFSIPYNRLSGATSSIGLFFGSLAIEIQGYEQNPPVLKHMWRTDVVRARRLINGLVTAHRQGIDLTKLDLTQATHLIEEIGTAEPS